MCVSWPIGCTCERPKLKWVIGTGNTCNERLNSKTDGSKPHGLVTSIRTTINTRALPQTTSWVHDRNTLIFQFGRWDLAGSKIKHHTTYPITLDSKGYHLTSGRPLVNLFALQTVIVHQGHEVDKGHYVIFIKLTNTSGWALRTMTRSNGYRKWRPSCRRHLF